MFRFARTVRRSGFWSSRGIKTVVWLEHFHFNKADLSALSCQASVTAPSDVLRLTRRILSSSFSLAFQVAPMNVSATLNVFSLLRNPSLCLPHATVPTFDRVPISIATALAAANGGQRPDIRAIVLDKDNCFAKPKTNSIHSSYKVRPTNFTRFLPPVSVSSGYSRI